MFSKINAIAHSHRTILFLIAFSFLYYLAGMYQGLEVYDEGFSVYGAERLLNGEIPYRDFLALHSPGIYYLQAGLFKLFGSSIIVERVLSSIFLSGLPIFAFLIASHFVSRAYALVAWFLCLVENIYWDFACPGVPALFFSLLSVLFLLKFMTNPSKKYRLLFFSGLSTGAAVLFRYDFGGYTFLAATMIIIPFTFRYLAMNRNDALSCASSASGYFLSYFLGLMVVVLPVIIFLAHAVPATDLNFAFVFFPLEVYSRVRSLPFPLLPSFSTGAFSPYLSFVMFGLSVHHSLLYYFAVSALIIAMVVLAHEFRKAPDWSERIRYCSILVILLLGLLFLNVARIRSDRVHILPSFTYAAILSSFLLSQILSKVNSRCIHVPIIIVVVAVAVEPTVKRIITIRESLLLSRAHSFTLPRARGVYCGNRTYENAVKYIRQKVPRDERIFVGNSRHDRLFMNDMAFYFLADRHSATKYHDLHPGIATTMDIQKRIISDIDAHGVEYIVLREWDLPDEPNESAISSGVTALDDFIREKFVPDQVFGAYSIWKRRPLIAQHG
jgi:hypothetical protein